MNVLVTGKNGFLAKEFSANLQGFNLTFVGREELDLTDNYSVRQFFKTRSFDAVLHTAIKGGRRDNNDTFREFSDNILMFNNILDNKHKYGKLINFCSGAAFGKGEVWEKYEHNLYAHMPGDPYGMSKNVIARECNKISNFYNLRIFGCFGFFEDEKRFIKSSMVKALKQEPINVHQNKMMDFVSSYDLCTVVGHFLENDLDEDYRDVNVCYEYKTTLKNIAHEIVSLTKSESEIIIDKQGYGYAYTGSSKKISSLNLDLQGTNKSLVKLLENLIG